MIINKFLKKNSNLKNVFRKKDCYIFGNGSSLKYFDLKKFISKPAFTCGWTFLHKDFKYLNVLADFEIHPGIFFPFWKNEYSKRLEYNYINYICKKKKRFKQSNYFFTSLINFPGLISYNNIYYIYHFGKKEFNLDFINPCNKFSLMENSLYSMIGIANYMGFENVYLVGMDYLLNKPIVGHFYENFEMDINLDKKTFEKNKLFFDFFSKTMNFKLIVPNKRSNSFLDSLNYSQLFKTKEKKYNNIDIIDEEDLKLLDKTNMNYRIF